MGDGVSLETENSSNNPDNDKWMVASFVTNTTNSFIRADGVLTNVSNTKTYSNTSKLSIGDYLTGTSYFKGFMKCAIYYTKPLTLNQVSIWESYLNKF